VKKFNLFKEIIIVEKKKLLQAINSSKVFGITISGEIKYEPFNDKEILIYQGKHTPAPTSALKPADTPLLEDILGKNYQLVIDDERVLIKAFSNWQELIGINAPRASYDDTTADGVAEFSNSDLEDIGWHATEFNINYRTLVEVLEENCSGTLLCIEQEEPYQFSGLAFLDDDEHAVDVLFAYCQKEVKKIMDEDPLFAKDSLSADEEDAAKFFKLV
jgi:hypothetical protein